MVREYIAAVCDADHRPTSWKNPPTLYQLIALYEEHQEG